MKDNTNIEHFIDAYNNADEKSEQKFVLKKWTKLTGKSEKQLIVIANRNAYLVCVWLIMLLSLTLHLSKV